MMKYRDLYSSFFCIAVAISFCIGAVKYGLFRGQNPGPGLFPFIAGISLILLSILILISSRLGQDEKGERGKFFFSNKDSPRKVIYTLCALVGYQFLFPSIGYLMTTFMFTLFLLTIIGRQKLKMALTTTVLTTVISYVVFVIILGVRFPKGILKF